MNKYQIAKRYSRTLINMVDIAQVGKVIAEIIAFSSALDANKKLRLLLASRIFSEEERSKALKELLPHLRMSQETQKFLTFIVSEGHLDAIKDVIKITIEMYNEKLKKAKALLISPVPMSGNYIERLKTALKALTRKDVEIESRIDESLIGGFIVKVGSTIYDSSIKGQLASLRAELTR